MNSTLQHPTMNPPPPESTSMRALLTPERWREIGRIIIVSLLTLLYWRGFLPQPVLYGAIALGLYPLVKTGLRDLIHERKIGTEIFVTVATTIAMIGGEYVAGAVLMTIILIAEFIADLNTDRARASIKALVGSVPQSALIRANGQERSVPITELKIGDIVLVRAGEKIPVDGTVVGGQGAVNEASITGESLPQEKIVDGSVLAGTLVESGALDIRTDKLGKDTMFARIIALVEGAEDLQAPVQKLADKVAAWLIPAVFVFLLGVYLVTHDLRKIVTLLIFTSPAELGLATPLVMIAAIARAARAGILVKGGIYLELLAKADVMVFDKTGTLTVGQPVVVGIHPSAAQVSEDELMKLAAAADRRSGHPLAKAVVTRAQEMGLSFSEPTAFEMVQGRGVKATVEGKSVLVGNAEFLSENNIEIPALSYAPTGTTIYVAVDGAAAGTLDLADQIRPGAKEAIARLKATGVKQVIMLTGDNAKIAQHVGTELGIDEVKAGLLPEDKVNAIVALQQSGHSVAMIGDGVNDAPALARAQVGIAMGARGTQAALEAADVALMTDDLAKIVFARALARRAYRTIQENLYVGVGVVHVLGITAALLGWIGPVQAAMIHLGPDILVFLNSVKLLRVKITT
ncbi:MAG: heavy metal translocating P-type ATPase [Prosthecobacter sp.]|nr:MAG: cadmium-translocating P-type ATPase [Chthoniobacter sp. 12-60-6]